VSAEEHSYTLRVTDPAEQQRNQLPEGTAAAIVEFMLGALLESPDRLGGPLQREMAGMRSARRGVYRIIYEIDDTDRLVIVYRIEHRATAYRPR
jgi:mRNA interferase RelE/StbE